MNAQRLAVAALLVAGSSAYGNDVTSVVPNLFENSAASSGFLGPLAATPRTYQLLIHENQLSGLVGLELTGLTWRLGPGISVPWPAADATYGEYNIFLSGSVDPEDRSNTFAENVVGPQTQVRSGSLDIDANSFTVGDNPNEFGMNIGFSNYLYTGGNLLVEIRHSGSNSTSRSVEAVPATGGAQFGYGTDFSALWTGSIDGETGTQGNFAVTQFTAIPTPGAVSLALIAGFAATRRRR